MARRLVVQPQANLDIQAATIWYKEQQAGLSRRFLDELGLVFRRIQGNPRQFPRLDGQIRRPLLRHFPYGVYFIGDSANLVILAVLHLHREPDMWKSRN